MRVILACGMLILSVGWKNEAKLKLSLLKKEQSLVLATIQGYLVFLCVCVLAGTPGRWAKRLC